MSHSVKVALRLEAPRPAANGARVVSEGPILASTRDFLRLRINGDEATAADQSSTCASPGVLHARGSSHCPAPRTRAMRRHPRTFGTQLLRNLRDKVPNQGIQRRASPSTEGAQSYYSVHKQKGMGCGTCHDPHEVTANDWKDRYTVPGLRKQCQDCHASQAAFFVKNNIHGSNRCTSCHMPVMMSCEHFGSIQFPDYAGFDTQRSSWLIRPRTLSRR